MKMQVAPELIEYSVGIYEGTSTLPDTAGAIADREIKTRWFEYNDFDACIPGGESLNDMKRRFLPFVKQTIQDASEPGIILLITHGGILEAMLPFVFGNVDFNFTRTHPIEHITIVKGKLQDGQLVCVEYNGTITMQRNQSRSMSLRDSSPTTDPGPATSINQ
jgi:broad specificity phosphatase PhoE